MFNKIKSLLKAYKVSNLTLQNRSRFDNIHADKKPNFLGSIYKRLISKDGSLTDQEVLDDYFKFSNHIQTNTFSAAEFEWTAISLLCYFRPHLTKILIRRGLLSIIWSIGDNINSSDIFDFIRQRILAPDVEPYGGLPPEVGIKWLKEILPMQSKIVQETLEEVIKQNNLDLEEI